MVVRSMINADDDSEATDVDECIRWEYEVFMVGTIKFY